MHALSYTPANEVAAATAPLAPRPKAYSYVRFSTKRQAKGDSLRRQLEKSRQYAAEADLDLQEVTFEDLGVSAFDQSNVTRGALAAFINAVASGAVERGSYLLLESLDRLSRAQVTDAIHVLTNLVKMGVSVVCVIDGRVLDQNSIKDPMNLLYVVMVFIRANEESEIKSERVKKAHKRKRDQKSPFAFGQGPGWLRPNADKSGWEPIPEKAESVVKVFELAAKGVGATAIARIANKEGWPVPGKAASWHKTLPNKLIHNRRVLGEFEPSVKDGKTRRPTGECWEMYYPPVVTADLFNAAQASAACRRNLPSRRDIGYHNVFQGFLRCGHCGATLSRKSKSSGRNSPGYAIYVCADRDRGLTNCPNWNARELEAALIPPLMACVSAEILKGSAKREAIEALDQERTAAQFESKALQNLLTVVEGAGPSPALGRRIGELEDRLAHRKSRIAELTAIANDPTVPVWEEDLDCAIADALRAVRDITNEHMQHRSELHGSFTRVVRHLWVWPESHAALRLNNDDNNIFLPLANQVPILAALTGEITLPMEQTDQPIDCAEELAMAP